MKSDPVNLAGRARRAEPFLAGLMIAGGIGVAIGLAVDRRQLGFSYLLAFMFYLSLSLGGLFLVLVHHLFDASWSVCVRRLAEHLGGLMRPLALFFLPLAGLAPQIYPWMDPAPPGLATHYPAAYLNPPFFYARALVYFGVWIFLAWRLRHWSLQQDATGAAICTHRLRRLSGAGIFLYAFTLTLAAVDWMKSLQPHWFSTMYGVYFFAGLVGGTAAVIFLLAAWLQRTGPLAALFQPRHMHDLGVLLLAFTIFYAYIHFSQYLIIWYGNLPEETSWYVLREQGYWWGIGLGLVFGRFLLPFLLLLRLDFKRKLRVMVPLCVWVCLTHYVDLSYNILPSLHREPFPWHWTDLACLAFLGGALGAGFLADLARCPVYPLRDPRLKEALGPAAAPAIPGATGTSTRAEAPE